MEPTKRSQAQWLVISSWMWAQPQRDLKVSAHSEMRTHAKERQRLEIISRKNPVVSPGNHKWKSRRQLFGVTLQCWAFHASSTSIAYPTLSEPCFLSITCRRIRNKNGPGSYGRNSPLASYHALEDHDVQLRPRTNESKWKQTNPW